MEQTIGSSVNYGADAPIVSNMEQKDSRIQGFNNIYLAQNIISQIQYHKYGNILFLVPATNWAGTPPRPRPLMWDTLGAGG